MSFHDLVIDPGHATHTGAAFSRHSLGADGLWLIAVGAVLLMVEVVVAGPGTGLSGRHVGPQSSRRQRAAHAFAAASAFLVAGGSILVAIAAFPRWHVWLITLAGAAILAAIFYRRNR